MPAPLQESQGKRPAQNVPIHFSAETFQFPPVTFPKRASGVLFQKAMMPPPLLGINRALGHCAQIVVTQLEHGRQLGPNLRRNILQ